MNSHSLKVGVVQQAVVDNDKNVNWARSAEQVSALADQGCELVMLQELHSTMYFCQQENTDNFDLAETIPGAATDYFAALVCCCHQKVKYIFDDLLV